MIAPTALRAAFAARAEALMQAEVKRYGLACMLGTPADTETAGERLKAVLIVLQLRAAGIIGEDETP